MEKLQRYGIKVMGSCLEPMRDGEWYRCEDVEKRDKEWKEVVELVWKINKILNGPHKVIEI